MEQQAHGTLQTVQSYLVPFIQLLSVITIRWTNGVRIQRGNCFRRRCFRTRGQPCFPARFQLSRENRECRDRHVFTWTLSHRRELFLIAFQTVRFSFASFFLFFSFLFNASFYFGNIFTTYISFFLKNWKNCEKFGSFVRHYCSWCK